VQSRVVALAAYALLVGAILAAVVTPRVATAVLPLGSDQGLYITIGEILNRGGVVARDTWDTKPPGVYYLYAGLMHFAPDYSVVCSVSVPFGGAAPHQLPCAQILLSTFDILYTLALCASVWWTTRRLFSNGPAIVAACLCAVFGSMLQISGGGGIADEYVLLPAALAFAAASVYATTLNPRWLVGAGMFGALAGMFKQTGFLLLVGISLWLVASPYFSPRRRRESLNAVLALAAGAATVLVLLATLLARSGVLGDVFYQAFVFNLFYVGRPANTNAFFVQLASQTWAVLTGSQIGLWVATFAGACFLAAERRSWQASLVLAWLGSSILSILAGGSQLHVNYYLALVPPLAICGGYGLSMLWKHGSVLHRGLLFVGGAVLLVYSNQFQDHQYGNAWYSRMVSNTHSTEEFVAGALGSGTGSLFVWGNGPQVYALAGRVPASRYLHTLGISYDYAVHDQLVRNRAELLSTLQQSPPTMIAIDTPWLRRAKTLEFPELLAFIQSRYELMNAPANPIFDGWEIYRRR
jgi:hypothetical protein